MSKGSYKFHKSLMGGEILLYILADSRTNIYQCRFINRLSDTKRYVRKSTGYRDESLATTFAINLYREYQAKQTLGLNEDITTIKRLYDDFMKDLNTVETRRKTVSNFYHTYWAPYFKNKDLSTISSTDIDEYFQHRLNTYFTMDKAKAWEASETSVSYSTLQTDKISLRMLLQLGERNRLIAKCPRFSPLKGDDPRIHRLPSNNSRGRFNDETYEIVRKDFSAIRKALKKPEWKPVLIDPDLPHNPETNPWVSQGSLREKHHRKMPKLYTEEGIKQGAYSYCQRDRRYLKATWWFFGILIANSGGRPSELIRLRHQDIKLIESDGEYFTVINVTASNSKTGKHRNMVCRDGHKTYERYLEYKKEIEYRFNKSDIKETDWLFPATGRSKSYDQYKSTQVYNDLARNNFKRLGIHTQEVTLFKGRTNKTVKVYFSFYSFRSWYIVQRLRNRLSIFTLSKQVGSSVATIQRYYEKDDMMYFKDEMIKHYKYDYDLGTVDDELKDHATEWKT
jgi:hypothetical protein